MLIREIKKVVGFHLTGFTATFIDWIGTSQFSLRLFWSTSLSVVLSVHPLDTPLLDDQLCPMARLIDGSSVLIQNSFDLLWLSNALVFFVFDLLSKLFESEHIAQKRIGRVKVVVGQEDHNGKHNAGRSFDCSIERYVDAFLVMQGVR